MALVDLGLSHDQERVYRHLVGSDDTGVAKLAAQLTMLEPTVRETVDALVERGLLQRDDSCSSGVRVPNVQVAIGRLIQSAEDSVIRQHRRITDTYGVAAALAQRHIDHDPGPDAFSDSGLERIEDLSRLDDRLAELAFFARASICIVQPDGSGTASALETARLLDERSLRRGLAVRCIYHPGALPDLLSGESLEFLTSRGALIRLTDAPTASLILYDASVAVVPIATGHPERGALVVRESGLVCGFTQLFESLWSGAQDCLLADSRPDGTERALNERDAEILQMLAAGQTDEAAARALNMSARHVRRHVASLMARLGAPSRFQAGVEAVRRGWL
jgi:DNA-binding CsgD family transcriptional regulator